MRIFILYELKFYLGCYVSITGDKEDEPWF